jgi:hypothetical protein
MACYCILNEISPTAEQNACCVPKAFKQLGTSLQFLRREKAGRRKIALRAWKLTIMQDCLSNSFAEKFANEQFCENSQWKTLRNIREIPLKRLRAFQGKNLQKTLFGAFCGISPKESPKSQNNLTAL